MWNSRQHRGLKKGLKIEVIGSETGNRTRDLQASLCGEKCFAFSPEFSPWGSWLTKKRYPDGYLFFVSARRGLNPGLLTNPIIIKEESTLSASCPQKCPPNSILSFSTDSYISYLSWLLFSKFSLL